MKERWECDSDHAIILTSVNTHTKEIIPKEINWDAFREWLQQEENLGEKEWKYVGQEYKQLREKMEGELNWQGWVESLGEARGGGTENGRKKKDGKEEQADKERVARGYIKVKREM